MRKTGLALLILSTACGKITSEKPNQQTRDISVDADFKVSAEQRLAELDQQIIDLQNQLKNENNDREKLEAELKQALFLKTWESIRAIQPCGSRFPNLMLNIGKRVAYPFTTVLRLKSPGDGNVPAGPLDPGEYFFAGHNDCPFRVELAAESIDIVGQTALNISSGEVQLQRVCWTSPDTKIPLCSSVLGDKKQ